MKTGERHTTRKPNSCRHETSSTVCLRLYSDGPANVISPRPATLNCDLLTPEFKCIYLCPIIHHFFKFGENLTKVYLIMDRYRCQSRLRSNQIRPEPGLVFILPLIAMLTKEPEMLQPDAFCKHTMQ